MLYYPTRNLRSEPLYNIRKKCKKTKHLLCEGGTLFCFVFDLGLSVSGNTDGTWEELLSGSPLDKVTDGSVETAGGRVLIGYFGIKPFQNFV